MNTTEKYPPHLKLILILSFSILAIFLTSVSSIFVKTKLTADAQNKAYKNISQLSEQFASRMDNALKTRFDILTNVSKLPEFGDKFNKEKIKETIIKMQALDNNFSSITFAKPDGSVVASTLNFLQVPKSNVKDFSSFKTGLNGLNYSDVYESSVLKKYINPNSTEPIRVIDISLPVRDSLDKITGVIMVQLSWNWVVSLEDSLHYPFMDKQSMTMLILDKNSKIIIGPTNMVGRTALTDVVARKPIGEDRTGYMDTMFDGKSYIVGYSSYDLNLQWVVVVIQDKEIALSNIPFLNLEILLITILATIIAILLGWSLASTISKPLTELEEEVKEISRKVSDSNYDFGKIQHEELPEFKQFKEGYTLTKAMNVLLSYIAEADLKIKYYENVIKKELEEKSPSN